MTDDSRRRDEKGQPVWLRFEQPIVRPGTPEAERAGCLCSFESNMAGAFESADRDDDWMIVAINNRCPLHQYSTEPPPGIEPWDIEDLT